MTKKRPSYTDREIKTLDVLRRNRMAWIAFGFLLAVFAIILAALLYAAFTGKGEAWLKVGMLLLDGLVGWCLKQVISYLFPTVTPKENSDKLG
jgi:crotonobetainyl-CoA:carnitine CoA-transferase CaiB-like acyl-CoA transferase